MLRALSLLLILALAACAGSRRAPPEPLPASALARAALTEWQAWGGIVIVGWPDQPPADTAATDERFNRLYGYWNALPGGYRIAQRHLAVRTGIAALEQRISADMPTEEGVADAGPRATVGLDDISFYANPAWSAAFISFVARAAGVPTYDLPSSSRHARYIDAVIARSFEDPEHAAFLPRAPEEYVPRPGDLLCADRSYYPLSHWTGRLAETGRPRPMHCDVVVRTAPGLVEAIGGNVQGMVVRRQFPSDQTGHVLPAPYGRPPFVVILADRANIAPPPVPAPQPE